MLPPRVAVEPAPESFEVGVVVSEVGVVVSNVLSPDGTRFDGTRDDGTPDGARIVVPATPHERDDYRTDRNARTGDLVHHEHPSAAVRTVLLGSCACPSANAAEHRILER